MKLYAGDVVKIIDGSDNGRKGRIVEVVEDFLGMRYVVLIWGMYLATYEGHELDFIRAAWA